MSHNSDGAAMALPRFKTALKNSVPAPISFGATSFNDSATYATRHQHHHNPAANFVIVDSLSSSPVRNNQHHLQLDGGQQQLFIVDAPPTVGPTFIIDPSSSDGSTPQTAFLLEDNDATTSSTNGLALPTANRTFIIDQSASAYEEGQPTLIVDDRVHESGVIVANDVPQQTLTPLDPQLLSHATANQTLIVDSSSDRVFVIAAPQADDNGLIAAQSANIG